MWTELFAALSLSAVTVLIHSLGSYGMFLWVTGYLMRHPQPSLVKGWWVLVRFVLGLLLLHAVEVAVWAEFYVFMHFFTDTGTAFYYSLSSYTTVGYGDVVLTRSWRFLGAWEAMLGVLMFGWSTAALAALIHHFHDIRRRNLLSRLGI